MTCRLMSMKLGEYDGGGGEDEDCAGTLRQMVEEALKDGASLRAGVPGLVFQIGSRRIQSRTAAII